MRLRECGKARSIFILYYIISIITQTESRSIQEQNELNPPAANAVKNLMGELKERLNNFLSSTREISKNDGNLNADKGTQERSSNVYKSTGNIQDKEFYQYRHHATPPPTLQVDGLLYDYDDNTIDNHETGNVHLDSNKKEVGTNDEIGIGGNAEESKGTKGEKEDFNNEVWIPDCDIPPYLDMLEKTRTNFPEEDDENRDDSDKGNTDINRKNDALMNDDVDNPVFEQKLEDRSIEELLDGSSGDMLSENMGKSVVVGSNANDIRGTVSIKIEDDFLKKLKDLKNSLGRMLSDEAPPESNLVNIMREMSEVLEKRFGEVERMHEKMRVRDLFGREKVKKIQDYHRKTTTGAADDKDNALLEVKKARKRLKFITKNNEEDLLPDYIKVMQELISMLRTTKRVVRGIEKETINDEKILGSNDAKSYALGKDYKNSQLKDRGSGNEKQVLWRNIKNLKRSNKWSDIDGLDSDSVEDLMGKRENFEDKLRNYLKKQSSSIDDRRGLEESETDSLEDEEIWMTKKQKKKKEKSKKGKMKGSFGQKVVEDL